MAEHQTAFALEQKAQVHAEPAALLRRNRGERAFDLHPAVHAMVAGAWLSFVAILCLAFMGPDLIVPTAIFVVGIVALFVTPGLWARVVPKDGLRKASWAEFRAQGVETHTGRLTSGEAMGQILILPAMLLGLAFFMAMVKVTL